MKAAFIDFDTVSSGDLDTASLRGAVDELRLLDIDEPNALQMMRGMQAVLLNKVKLTRSLLEQSPDLQLIALAATGTDNVDLKAARERGIAVCNVTAYCTSSVAQHVWALLLTLNQHVIAFNRMSRDGSWTRDEAGTVLACPIRELSGLNFGVIGWGELGRGSARIAEAFGMRVLIGARPGEPVQPGRVPLDELYARADVISLHCPLTTATRGLIGTRELNLMKPSALLINTARGGLIDSQALALALKARRIAGAGLDVMAEEPPASDDPLLDPELENILITPHVAWAAQAARQRCIDEMAANIRDFREGGRRGRVV